MGSSPFTATTSFSSQQADLVLETVERFVESDGAASWLVAFSGGPDSTALAWALGELARERRHRSTLRVVLVHVDHGLDPESSRRAEGARQLAARLDLPFSFERLPAYEPSSTDSSGLEDWARRGRYAALARHAAEHDCARIATAHHADDQAETLLLRLAFGTGLYGLAGIRERRDAIVRPLLNLRRHQLRKTLEEVGLEPITDPTNRDLSRPRNRIRHRILPEWKIERPTLVDDLHRLARLASRSGIRLDDFFASHIDIHAIPGGGARLDRQKLRALPRELFPHALAAAERLAGKALPSAASARRELARQLEHGDRVGCDAGGGWRWQGDGRSLRLLPPRKPLARFTYTVGVPGSVSITEIGALLRISTAPGERSKVAERPRPGHPGRVYLRPPSSDCHRVEIRNRRPGDRLRPIGRRRERRLKELLIDQRIPREQRDHLPLVVVENRLAWVPGVAVSEDFRPRSGEPCWLVEIHRTDGSANDSATDRIGDFTEDKR